MIFELIGKLISLHMEMDVNDESGAMVYKVRSKLMSASDKTTVFDKDGREIAKFHKKMFSLHNLHTIEFLGGEVLTMKLELLHPFKDVIDVEENGWTIKGNFMSHTYKIYDQDEEVLAEITRPWISVHNKCRIDVKDEKNTNQLIVLTIVLEHILIERSQKETVSVSTAGGAAGGAIAAGAAESGQ